MNTTHPVPRRRRSSSDPFWWSLFGAGGALSAMFVPALLFLTGIATPLGWVHAPGYEAARGLLLHPVVRLLAFALISLSFFHWAHRFRFTLYDGLQLKHLFGLIAVICYGGAVVGTVVAALAVW